MDDMGRAEEHASRPPIAEYAPERAATVARKARRPLHRWLMEVLGNEWGGNAGPPAGNRKMYVHDDGVYRVFSMQDDGGFVGIGYPDEWHVIMRTEAARWFAWWTFKVWAADWFGLRSKLWYMALHRSVRGVWKWTPYRHRRRVWPSSYEAWWSEHKAQNLIYPITICEGETPGDCDASSSGGRCDTCGKAKP